MDDDRAGRLASLCYEIALAEDIGELRAIVTRGLGAIVGADLASYTEVSPASGTTLALLDAPVPDIGREGNRLAELAHQHPLIVRHAPNAEAISDHLSSARFRSLELYQDIYRGLGAADQLAITIHHDAHVVVGLALNRSRRGFGVRDREALEALAGVVRVARGRVIARTRARALLAELERGEQSGPFGVIALSDHGVVEFVSDRAREWLRSYVHSAQLPPSLLTGPAARERILTVEGPDATLTIRCLPARGGEPRLLELHERRRASDRVLTVREHEILDRLSCGDSNAAIAQALEISPRTVENHLRSIYRKLEVSSRTAALARMRG